MKKNRSRSLTRPVPTEPTAHLSTPQHKGDVLALGIAQAVRRAEMREECRAQNGPVKVIMKDGRRLAESA